jgi:hypothetical protein
MPEMEKLKRDLDALNETVRLDWMALGSRQLSREERTALRNSIRSCTAMLAELLKELDDSVGIVGPG